MPAIEAQPRLTSETRPAAKAVAHPHRNYTPVVIFFLALVGYHHFPTRNWNYAETALVWATAMRDGDGLIHHHHLHLNALRWVYREIAVPISILEEPARFLSFYSAVTGALGLSFLYLLLKNLRCRYGSLLGTFLCGTTAGYWSYSIVGDVYIPTVAFMIAGIYFTCRALAALRPHTAGWNWFGAVICFLLMLAHHQAYAVLVIGLCPAILLFRRHSLRRRLAAAIGLPLVIGLCALALYSFVYSTLPPEHRAGYVEFVSGYAPHAKTLPDMKQFNLGSMVNAAAGCTRAMLSTNFLFKSLTFAQMVQARFPYRHIYPYPFLIRDLSWSLTVLIAVCFVFTFLAILFTSLYGMWRAVRNRDLPAVVLVAAIPQALVFLWWQGISDSFWLWTAPLVSVAVVIGTRAMRQRGEQLLLVLCGTMALVTFASSIHPLLWSHNDIDWLNRHFIHRLNARDGLIAMNELASSARFELARQKQGFDFFSLSQEALTGKPFNMDKLQQFIKRISARGGTVYIDPYVEVTPKSYLRVIRMHNRHFRGDWPHIREVLHGVYPTSVRWAPIIATVPDFFEEQPLVSAQTAETQSAP